MTGDRELPPAVVRGTRVFKCVPPTAKKGHRYYCKTIAGGKLRLVIDTTGLATDHEVSYSPNGKYMLFMADGTGWEIFDLILVETSTGHRTTIKAQAAKPTAVWLPDESGFYFLKHSDPSLCGKPLPDFRGRVLDKMLIESAETLRCTLDELRENKAYANAECLALYKIGNKSISAIDEVDCRDACYLTSVDTRIIASGGNSLRIIHTDGELRIFAPLEKSAGIMTFLGHGEGGELFGLNSEENSFSVLKLSRDGDTYTSNKIIEKDGGLIGCWIVKGHVFIQYYEPPRNYLHIHDFEGELVRELELPPHSDIDNVESYDNEHAVIECSGLTQPPFRQVFNVVSHEFFVKPHKLNFATSQYECQTHLVPGKSGTKIPIVVASKTANIGGGVSAHPRPVILYAYGGYGINSMPGFNSATAAWLELGGTLVLAQIRGGAELGRLWHEQAGGIRKQNSINDLIAVAEWLISNGYCNAHQLGIQGFSHGGMLAAAAVVQRPDLFGCLISISAPLDLVNRSAIGGKSRIDYGNPEDESEFKYALSISPYQNLRRGVNYPPCIAVTRESDSRVRPTHAFKFIAALQRLARTEGRHILRYEDTGGHVVPADRLKVATETADWLAFAAFHLGLTETPSSSNLEN